MVNQVLDPNNPARASDGTLRSVEEMQALGVEFPYSPSSITNVFDSKLSHRIESSESNHDGPSEPIRGMTPNVESTSAPAVDMHNYSIARREAILAKCRAADSASLDELGELHEYMEGKLIPPRDDFN